MSKNRPAALGGTLLLPSLGLWGLGFGFRARVLGFGFRVQGLGFKV